jgi:hypothetical protein
MGFTVVASHIDLLTKNPPQGYGAALSARMDFREYNRIEEDVLNRILWHSIKGVDVPYPAPMRRARAFREGNLRASVPGNFLDETQQISRPDPFTEESFVAKSV